MRYELYLIAITIALSGCAYGDANLESKLRIERDNQAFVFETISQSYSPEDDARSEEIRLSALDRFVKASGICPEGYEVTERQLVKQPFPYVYDIYYSGNCTIH